MDKNLASVFVKGDRPLRSLEILQDAEKRGADQLILTTYNLISIRTFNRLCPDNHPQQLGEGHICLQEITTRGKG